MNSGDAVETKDCRGGSECTRLHCGIRVEIRTGRRERQERFMARSKSSEYKVFHVSASELAAGRILSGRSKMDPKLKSYA